MTSAEINGLAANNGYLLKEVAYQLALLNEKLDSVIVVNRTSDRKQRNVIRVVTKKGVDD